MKNLHALKRHFVWFFFCMIFSFFCIVGCHVINKTPSRDFFNYKFMNKEWEPVVREIVTDSDRQDQVLQWGRITTEGFQKLQKDTREIQREFLSTLACYDCDPEAFEPILERIQKTNETAIVLILDMMDGVKESTTEEELKELIKRKLKS